MSLHALRRRLAGEHDAGIAMILVLGVVVMVTAMIATLLDYTVVSIKHARNEQDTQAAITAAQAGVDDFLSRLNANNVYWQTTDCSNPALPRPFPGPTPDCAWGVGTAVGWTPIAGASAPDGTACSTIPTPAACAVYHYDVDASGTIVNGTIALIASGRSKGITRTVSVSVRRQSFADFLYFTNYETSDPTNRFLFGVNNVAAMTECTRHFWDVPTRTGLCRDIVFITGDTINGPVHSNDALYMFGRPRFLGAVSTGYPSCQTINGVVPPVTSCYRDADSLATVPVLTKGISYGGNLPLPASNGALQAQTVSATALGAPGCGYTGPTRIHFKSDGTMDVWSPYTATVNAGCGTAPFTAVSQNIPVPANNVIYVSPVPSAQVLPTAGNCSTGDIGGYPQANDWNVTNGDYDCRAGFALVDGVVNGRVTIGAAGNIIVTDDLTYAGGTTGADTIGLVAGGSVEVYHPVQCTATDGAGTCTAGNNLIPINHGGGMFTNPTIQAAMLALDHGFTVQLYSLGGSFGTLNVYGSIGQLFRGAVGQNGASTHGYLKGYNYDTRLQFAPPPFYLTPVQSKYISAVFSEIAPAY